MNEEWSEGSGDRFAAILREAAAGAPGGRPDPIRAAPFTWGALVRSCKADLSMEAESVPMPRRMMS